MKAYSVAPLMLLNQKNDIDTTASMLQLNQDANIVMPLIFLWVFFGLFMLFNVFFSFAAILLITEAAMLTLILLLTISLTSYFPNLTADILNLLNASAMEAIIGITIVFVHQKSWKSRYTNSMENVLESSWLSTYLYLMYFGHLSWSIVKITAVVIYCGIRSMFKLAVKIGVPVITKLLEITQWTIEWIIFFWMCGCNYQRKVTIDYIFFKKIIRFSWEKVYVFTQIWSKILFLKKIAKKCEDIIRGYFLRKKDYEAEQYKKETEQRYAKANHAINSVRLPAIKTPTYAKGPAKISNIHTVSRRKKHTKRVTSSKVLGYLFYIKKENICINKIRYVKPQTPPKGLTALLTFLGCVTVLSYLYLYYSNNIINTEDTLSILNLNRIFYWSDSKNIILKAENNVENFKIAIKRVNQATGVNSNVILMSENSILWRLSNISAQPFVNFANLNPKDIIIDIKKIILNQKNQEKMIDSYEQSMNLWHIAEAQKYQINKLNQTVSKGVRFETDLLDLKFQNNILKKRYNAKKNNYQYFASNFWGKINIGEKLENQITSAVKLGLDSEDRSKIREKLLNSARWRGKFSKVGGVLIEKTTQISEKDKVYDINYIKNIDLLENKIKIDLAKYNKIILLESLKNEVELAEEYYTEKKYYEGSIPAVYIIKQTPQIVWQNEITMFINFFKNIKPEKVRPLGIKQNIIFSPPIRIKENFEIYTCYTKPKEKLNWSAKNWDSIFTYNSKLLPWYENADIEDDYILEDAESFGGIQEMVLSQKLKENLLEDQIQKIDQQTKELSLRNSPIYHLSTLTKNSIILKNIHVNTEILENLEISYKKLGVKLEGLDVSQKLSIYRNPLPFPVMSPRTINNLTTDTLFNVNSTVYSKGSAQTPLTVINKESLKTEEKINLLSLNISNQKPKRLFSFSSLDLNTKKTFESDLSLLGSNSNFNKYTKNKLNQNLQNIMFDIEKLNQNINQILEDSVDEDSIDQAYNIFRFQNLSTTKIKTLINGNTPKINRLFYSRKEDILNNRKTVEDRMVKPVKDIVYSRIAEIYEGIIHPVRRVALSDAMLFIEKNDRFRETPELTTMKNAYEKVNYDGLLGIASKSKTDKKVFFDDDFEIDIDTIRTTATQPHSLYGLMWDEYLKQSYNVSLQFIDFNGKFEDYYKNELKTINFDYTENLEKVLGSDLRYSFSINDEIKNTLFNKMLPKIGYFSELNNPSMQYLNLEQKQKKNTLLFLKEKFYTGRIYKKKLKKYIARRIKYSEKPIGFKYDQQPHQIKLPYRKKLLWIHGGIENQYNNFGFATNTHLKKKNQTEWASHRYRQTLPYGKKYFKLPIAIKKSHRLPIYTFRGYRSMEYLKKKNDYSRDKFKNGVEYFFSVKNQTKSNQNLLYRFGLLKNNETFAESTGYLTDNTKTGVWKKKKQKMRIKKNMRIFTKYFLHGMSIFETRGTNKYQNDNYFYSLIDKYRLSQQKENRRYDTFSDYTQPVVGLYRSGDIENEKNVRREEYLKVLRFNFLVDDKVVYTPIVDQLDNFRLKTLSKNFHNNSLKTPQNQQENQLYSLEFYADLTSQGQNYEENWGVFNGGACNIIKDNTEFFKENSLGFSGYSDNILTFASLEENNLIFSELEILKGSGPANLARNYYTYFNTNVWDLDQKAYLLGDSIKLVEKTNSTKRYKIKLIATVLKLDEYLITLEVITKKLIKKLLNYIFLEKNNSLDLNKNLIKYKQIIWVWKINTQLLLIWIIFNAF